MDSSVKAALALAARTGVHESTPPGNGPDDVRPSSIPPPMPVTKPKTKEAANAFVGGLSGPSKMPEGSIGLSAHACKTGSALAKIPGSVCSTCYALKGMYVLPNTKKAHDRRWEAVDGALKDPQQREHFVGSMAKLMEGKRHFRWHDSGDISSPEHLGLIADVARASPETMHWVPTKEKGFLKEYLRSGGKLPPNLVVRLSGAMTDDKPPIGYPLTSPAHQTEPPPP